MGEVKRAHEVLAAEREAVVAELRNAAREQRAEARRAAERRRRSRQRVVSLLTRGKAAGLPVAQMAAALGVSRQWATQLLARAERDAASPNSKGGKHG
jgi:hypothetical protein